MLLVRNIFEDILTYGNSMRYHESWKLIMYYHLLILSSQYMLCILKAIAYTNQQLVKEWKYLLKLKVVSITNISIFHLEQNCWNDCSLHLIVHPALQ